MNQPVIYEKIGGIAKIWLNRPEVNNKINRAMFLGLDKAISDAAKDEEVRVIIIAGKGENFCMGFDINDSEVSLNNNEDGTVRWEDRRQNTQEEIDLWMKIYNLSKPVIGVTQGVVMGGGVIIAFLCDCLIASEDTVFDNSEFALGLSYTNYIPFDAWKIPMNIAKEKAFTGYSLTAEEGYRLGMFNRVVKKEKTDAAAMKMANRMLKLAPYTLTMHKELYNMCYELQGIKSIIPFGKEVFNIALHLPGTAENEELWRTGREQGEEALYKILRQRLRDLKTEEQAEL